MEIVGFMALGCVIYLITFMFSCRIVWMGFIKKSDPIDSFKVKFYRNIDSNLAQNKMREIS